MSQSVYHSLIKGRDMSVVMVVAMCAHASVSAGPVPSFGQVRAAIIGAIGTSSLSEHAEAASASMAGWTR